MILFLSWGMRWLKISIFYYSRFCPFCQEKEKKTAPSDAKTDGAERRLGLFCDAEEGLGGKRAGEADMNALFCKGVTRDGGGLTGSEEGDFVGL